MALRRSGVEIAEDTSVPVAVSSQKSVQSQKSAPVSQKTLTSQKSGAGVASVAGSQKSKKSVNSISSAKKSVPQSEKGSQTASTTHGSKLMSTPGSVAGGSNLSLRQEKGVQVRSKEGSLHSQYSEAAASRSRSKPSSQLSSATIYEDKGTQVYLSNDELFSVPGSQRGQPPLSKEPSKKSMSRQASGSPRLSQAGSQTASVHASQAGSVHASQAGSAQGSQGGSVYASAVASAAASGDKQVINGGEFEAEDTTAFCDREIQVSERDGVLYSDYSEEAAKSVLEETDVAATEVTAGSVKSVVKSELSVPSNERGVQVRTVEGMLQSMSEMGQRGSGAIYTDAAEVDQIGSQPDVKPAEEGSAAASKTGIELLEDEARVLIEDKGVQVYFRDWVLVSQTSSYRSGSASKQNSMQGSQALLGSAQASRTGSVAASGSAHPSRAGSTAAGSAHPSRAGSMNAGGSQAGSAHPSRAGSMNAGGSQAGSAHPSRAGSVNASQGGSTAEAVVAEGEATEEAPAEAPAEGEEAPAEEAPAEEAPAEEAPAEEAPAEGEEAPPAEEGAEPAVEGSGPTSQAALGSNQPSGTVAAAMSRGSAVGGSAQGSAHPSRAGSQASRQASVAASGGASQAAVADGENPYDGLVTDAAPGETAGGEMSTSGELTTDPGAGMMGSVHEDADVAPVGSAANAEADAEGLYPQIVPHLNSYQYYM